MKDVNTYIQMATEKFEAGFTSAAGQKRALEDVNHAFDWCTSVIKQWCLKVRQENYPTTGEDVHPIYWDMPGYPHQWRVKHSETLREIYPEADTMVPLIEQIVELRRAIRDAEVVKLERKASDREESVVKSIREIMEMRKAQYARGLKLFDLFKGLPVTANVHQVVNQHGTQFLRAFYYMEGRMTPLSIILAVMDAKAEK